MPGEERRDLWELLPELERQEHRILKRVRGEEASLLRTGVALVDYAVDQVRYFLEGWRGLRADGLTDLAALEQAEFLSLPECLRQAKRQWKKDLLLKYAGSRQWFCWQRVLDARRPTDEVNVLPRQPGWPGATVQLSPYPSSQRLPKGAMVTLEAAMHPNPGLQPSPVHPVRKLQFIQGLGDQFIERVITWSLELVLFHKKRSRPPLRIFIDPPWDFDVEAARVALRNLAAQLEATAESAARRPDPPPEEAIGVCRRDAEAVRAAADRLGPASASERAVILQRCFSLPGAIHLSAVTSLTEDLPPDRMGALIGFRLRKAGLLSVREGRRIDKYAERLLLMAHEDLTPAGAKQMGKKLATFVRPLRQESLTSYERKMLRRIRSPRPPKEKVGKVLRDLAAQRRMNLRTIYRRFATFIKERGLIRDRRAVRLFGRTLGGRRNFERADQTGGQGQA